MANTSSQSYAKGYITGQVSLLQNITQRLREDSEIRTVVAVQELLSVYLEGALKDREKIYAANSRKEPS